jgi:hypothetical protein
MKKTRERHGLRSTPEYVAWQNMKARTSNLNHTNYDRYGKRGIRVCDRWANSFIAFLADMGPKPGPEYSLERQDNDGDYTPENCVWASRETQARNRSNVHHVTIGNRTMTPPEWVDEAPEGITGQHIRARLKMGWEPEQAVFTPLRWVWRKNNQEAEI